MQLAHLLSCYSKVTKICITFNWNTWRYHIMTTLLVAILKFIHYHGKRPDKKPCMQNNQDMHNCMHISDLPSSKVDCMMVEENGPQLT